MSSGQRLDRRRFAVTIAASGIGLGLAAAEMVPRHALMRDRRPARSRVAILTADRYSDALEQLLYDGLKLFNLGVKGKNVLLKPNLVEYSADAAINTHPALVGAAAVAFLRLGAEGVTVAEGPGHQRDTFLLLVESGLGDQPLRANIDETVLLVVITEQGENRNQCEEQWISCGFSHDFARRGT